MDSVVLASPENYKISYSLNPLTNKKSVVDPKKAMEQFQRLKVRIESHHIPVHVIDAKTVDPKYPDLVFVSNSALILRGSKVAILSRYANPERQGEEERVGAYLKHVLGYKVISLPDIKGLYFEGQGDTRWSSPPLVVRHSLMALPQGSYQPEAGWHLWMCYGGRTTKAGIEAVTKVIQAEATKLGTLMAEPYGNASPPLVARIMPPTIHTLHIVDKKTYHLDLCFMPLINGRVLFHDSSFSVASRKEIENHFGKDKIINVPMKYMNACNSVQLNEKTLLIPKLGDGCRQWMHEKTGMRIEEVNVGEFHLAGGSVSCMVLPLWSK